MKDELVAIQKAMDNQAFDKARKLADAYVDTHPDEFEDYREMTRQEVIESVEVDRAAKRFNNQYRGEAYLLWKWEPHDGVSVQIPERH